MMLWSMSNVSPLKQKWFFSYSRHSTALALLSCKNAATPLCQSSFEVNYIVIPLLYPGLSCQVIKTEPYLAEVSPWPSKTKTWYQAISASSQDILLLICFFHHEHIIEFSFSILYQRMLYRLNALSLLLFKTGWWSQEQFKVSQNRKKTGHHISLQKIFYAWKSSKKTGQ